MGRRKQDGLDYFPLDCGFFKDPRIRRLISRFGSDGALFYLYILANAYDHGFYVAYTEDFKEDAAIDLNCSVEKIDLMLHYLLDKTLLDSTLFSAVKVLSSHGIQTQYQESKKGLKRDVEVDENFWILDESETQGFIKVRHGADKSGINADKSGINAIKESKGNKREMKENKINSAARPQKRNGDPPTLDEVLEFAGMNGCDEKNARDFFRYFSAGEWKDRNGVSILMDWRKKLISWDVNDKNRRAKEEIDRERSEKCGSDSGHFERDAKDKWDLPGITVL